MSKIVPFDNNAICDGCGQKGAHDFMGDFYCPECASKDFKFHPFIYYIKLGDLLHYQNADEAVVAEHVDQNFTLYRSGVDDRIIGFEFNRFSKLLSKKMIEEIIEKQND